MQGHMIVALGSDHGGYDLKQKVIGYLKEKEIEYRDFGCESRESCDYPEYGRAAAEAVAGVPREPVSPTFPSATARSVPFLIHVLPP